jgi:hypothetical protein
MGRRCFGGDARAVPAPTADELKKTTEDFDRDWGAVDDVVHGICRQCSQVTD